MKKTKPVKQDKTTFKYLGIAFMVLGIIAVAFGETGMYAAWFPIGAAFLVLGFNE